MHAIAEFGPLAARRAAPQVIAGLSEMDDRYNNHAVQCVGWLLPESASALTAFKHGLAGADPNWPVPDTFLSVAEDSVWAMIPEVVPLLTNFLGDSFRANLAAADLGCVGSNAAAAVPALIQTAEMGEAWLPDTEGALMPPHGNGKYSTQMMNHNRAMAALALGRIGVTTPEVRAALVRAWNAPDACVRKNAAEGVALLGPSMTNDLSGLLAGLRDKDNSALDKKLRAIWMMGAEARDAIETLRELAQTNRLRLLVTNPEPKVVGGSLEDLAVSAKMAICRIDPEEGRSFLPDIASKIGVWWDPVEFLVQPSPLSNDVVRVVEPLLEQAGSARQSIAAYVILHHDRHHSKALAVLRRNESAGELNEMLLAGRLLFQSVGETNGLCSLVAEGFKAPESFIGQSAGNLAEAMGEAALPALPAFKKALWHQDKFVRQKAGELRLKLDPQEIPINAAK
jgi:hypothetical protein